MCPTLFSLRQRASFSQTQGGAGEVGGGRQGVPQRAELPWWQPLPLHPPQDGHGLDHAAAALADRLAGLRPEASPFGLACPEGRWASVRS